MRLSVGNYEGRPIKALFKWSVHVGPVELRLWQKGEGRLKVVRLGPDKLREYPRYLWMLVVCFVLDHVWTEIAEDSPFYPQGKICNRCLTIEPHHKEK